nr:RNA-directed DNA polymerase, eukaryota, reverse transcriptase zinc-binding domain protein [Tanacetum cinerariifolium]
MGSYRGKEYEVLKISTSVFVANFLDSFGAKDLWNTCKQYGQVVDAYISYRRSKAVMVVDDSCLNEKDYSLCLMGTVKDFATLENLKVVVANEGFDNIKFKYMGGHWIQLASCDFNTDGKVTWVEIEGIPLKMWSKNTLNYVASKWGVLLDVDDQEDGHFHRKRICINTNVPTNIFDSFKLIYRGKVFWARAKEVPGWIPDFVKDNDEEEDLEVDGFDKFIEDSWKDAPIIESNDLVRMTKKLKYLKEKNPVIKALHGYDGKIGQKVKSCYPSLWLDIIHEVEMFKSRGIDLVSLIHSKLGLDVSFRRPPRGGVEIQQFEHMKEKVEGKMIDDFMLPEVSSKMRWIKAVPIKVNVHAWKVKLDDLPTRLNISCRGIDIESILCSICGKAVESTSHIFFTYQMSKEIFRKISRLWDIDYMEISSYEEWLDWILNTRLSMDLELDVSKEELKRAVWDCGMDQSPGPDG